MPGGSVNGRPFRDDPTSYKITGVPCGNPERFNSAGVMRLGPGGGPRKNVHSELPTETIETEGERQFQNLLKRQLDTNISVKEYKRRYKDFSASTKFLPNTSQVAGERSLEDYRQVMENESCAEELRQCGLNEEEIQLKLGDQNKTTNKDTSVQTKRTSRYGIDPQIHKLQMEAIDKKIEAKQELLSRPDKFSGTKVMSRHEMDLEHAVSHDRENSRTLSLLMTIDAERTVSHKHNIDKLMSDFLHTHECKTSNRNTSKNITSDKSECVNLEDHKERRFSGCHSPSCSNCSSILSTLSQKEMDTRPHKVNFTDLDRKHQSENNSSHSITSADPKSSDIEGEAENNETLIGPRELKHVIEMIPDDVISSNRLSVEDIRKIPKFKDYEPGEPSETLFLKNLSYKVSEEELVSLFGRFQKPDGTKIVFRLLSGRMKGQAFITFESVGIAIEAMDFMNGYNLRGKPIVILYSRKKMQQT